LRAARQHADARHFAVPFFEDVLVFGVGGCGFLAAAAREACVDLVVEGPADGFADALGGVLGEVATEKTWRGGIR
jgi:hypothetical protein